MTSSASSKNKPFDIQSILTNVPLLSGIGRGPKKQLAKELVTQIFQKGQNLMTEGEEGDQFFIIVDGKVDVKSNSGGHLAYLVAGDYAGEQALLKSMRRNATLTAVQKTTCLVMNKRTFEKIRGAVKFGNRYETYATCHHTHEIS